MFYCVGKSSGLPRDPWMMCVIPRPIGWISTIGRDGKINLAPYSFFNAVAEDPPMVMFASNGAHPHGDKDTARNIRATGEFVCNMATWDLRDAVKRSSAPVGAEINEFVLAELDVAPSVIVKPPRVKASPIQLECRLVSSFNLPPERSGAANTLLVGEVVGIHIRDDVLVDGRIEVARLRPLARLGYDRFAVVENDFLVLPHSTAEPLRQHDVVGPGSQ